MIHLYQKITHLRVLRHFFSSPNERFYLREMARLLEMSPMTLKRSLDALLGDDLIVREVIKNQILYRANVDNQAFRFAKIAYNLSWLEKNSVVESLVENVPGTSSIVFYGSHAKGENDRHSDLDLLIISTAKAVETSDIEKKLGVDVNVMNFSRASWTKQAKNNRAFYLDIITEGIVLYGTRPVVE
ncbi:MAG: nucleotidyltransferase domain-containing protein [Methanomassiliicoccales archaeon]|nr:MAG: nucleotidyltransferase domain-containing protein [Methanomassiliicoccales archaeon]